MIFETPSRKFIQMKTVCSIALSVLSVDVAPMKFAVAKDFVGRDYGSEAQCFPELIYCVYGLPPSLG
jgi:hypothetical protein